MNVEIKETEVRAHFGELNKDSKKIIDLRTIDSKYIIKALENKIVELKTIK